MTLRATQWKQTIFLKKLSNIPAVAKIVLRIYAIRNKKENHRGLQMSHDLLRPGKGWRIFMC